MTTNDTVKKAIEALGGLENARLEIMERRGGGRPHHVHTAAILDLALAALDGAGDARLRELRRRMRVTGATFKNRRMPTKGSDFDAGYIDACTDWANEIDRLLAKPEQPAAEKPAAAPSQEPVRIREGALQGTPTHMTEGERAQIDGLKRRAFEAAAPASEPGNPPTIPDGSVEARIAEWEREARERLSGVTRYCAECERLTGIIDDLSNTKAVDADTIADLRAKLADAEKQRDSNAVAAKMLERWRERRARCLEGVAPTLAEIESEMTPWTSEVVAQKSAPAGSAMRRAIDAGEHIIGLLWKHSESLRERFDAEMEKANAERDDDRALREQEAALAAVDEAAYRAQIKALEHQTRCPECGCATPEDAEAAECGCDAPVCAIPSSSTLAQEFVKMRAERDAAVAAKNERAVAELEQFGRDALHLQSLPATCPVQVVRDIIAEKLRDRIAALRAESPAPQPVVPAFEGDPKDCAFKARPGDHAPRLFFIQDGDRPMHVVAPDWNAALAAWRRLIASENEGMDAAEPEGISKVADANELLIDEMLRLALARPADGGGA